MRDADDESAATHVAAIETAWPGAAAAETPHIVAVDGLISRLDVIGQQPLARRAAAFGDVHDELRRALEAG